MKSNPTTKTSYIKSEQLDIIKLSDYIEILRKRFHITFLFFLLIVFIGISYTYSQVPLYSASTKILIEQSNPEIFIPNFTSGNIHNPHFLNSQIELLNSKNVIEKTVNYLSKNNVLLTSFTRKENFLSHIKDFIRSLGSDQEPNDKDPASTHRKLLKTICSTLSHSVKIDLVNESNVIKITFLHQDPLIAQKVVQLITRAYTDELLELKKSSSTYALSWLTTKAEEEREKLEEIEHELHTYMRKNQIVTIEDKIASTPELLRDYSQQLSKAKIHRHSIEEIYLQTQEYPGNYQVLESLPVFSSNSHLQNLRKEILVLEKKYLTLKSTLGPRHPLLKEISDEIALLQQKKIAEIDRFISQTKNELELAKTYEDNLAHLLEETKAQTLEINEKLFQYNILKREVDTNRTIFESLLKGIKEQNITGNTKSVTVHIIEQPELPNRPTKPQKIKNILVSIIFGLLGGTCLALIVDYLDNKIASKEQIERNYNVKVIGEIEQIKNNKASFTDIMLKQDSFFSINESYRMIRSAIKLSSAETPVQTLLITSPTHSEGKTSTCINLATALAFDDKSVLVIDCDMRKPSLHKYLNVDNRVGLSSYLAGLEHDNIILEIPDYRISIIPSGEIPPNPSELLGSKRMEDLLTTLRNKHDYILIDSPPILAVTDADILNSLVDGTMLVVRAHSTTSDNLTACLKKLDILGTKLIGLILNGKKQSGPLAHSYYYNEYRQSVSENHRRS